MKLAYPTMAEPMRKEKKSTGRTDSVLFGAFLNTIFSDNYDRQQQMAGKLPSEKAV
jgi:hypothetical protein